MILQQGDGIWKERESLFEMVGFKVKFFVQKGEGWGFFRERRRVGIISREGWGLLVEKSRRALVEKGAGGG